MYFVMEYLIALNLNINGPGLELEDSPLSPVWQKLLIKWRLVEALFLLLALQYLSWFPLTDYRTR